MANPRLGHLEVLYHMFAYIKNHKDMGQLAYDPKMPKANEAVFNSKAV